MGIEDIENGLRVFLRADGCVDHRMVFGCLAEGREVGVVRRDNVEGDLFGEFDKDDEGESLHGFFVVPRDVHHPKEVPMGGLSCDFLTRLHRTDSGIPVELRLPYFLPIATDFRSSLSFFFMESSEKSSPSSR